MEEKYEWKKDYGPYEQEIIENLYNKRLWGIPVAFFILDLRKTNTRCWESSAMLAYVIPDAIRVSGNVTHVRQDDKWHCWVEVGDKVYETSCGLCYKRDVWYEREKPLDIKCDSREETLKSLQKGIERTENQKEMYVALVRDMEANLDGNPYRRFLERMIEVFKKEKQLDVQDYDEDLVQKYLERLREIYRQIEEFLAEKENEAVELDQNKPEGEEH